ncbi:MAG: N-6 DNA methylase [bacterium]
MNAETKRRIDAARQVLVGVVPNPTSQIDQITNALIYKFMDDMDQSAIKSGGDASFFTGELEKYAWTRLMDTRVGNQERMNLYSEALVKFSESKQLPELFRNIFKSAYLPYRSPDVLGLFLKEIDYFNYSHPEELGNAYEYLLSIMSSQGDAGQFRTPRHIIDFIVEAVNPTKDDKVLDPACGTGGFLISAYKNILKHHDGKDDPKKKEKPLTPDQRRTLMQNFEGYDIDPGMVRIAQVNMYLHQFKNPKIVQYDSLSMDERWNDKFDVILANPPFMTPNGGIRPHNKFSVKANRAEVLFVDYIIGHLKPNGRSGIIVPDGVITTKGKDFSSIRKTLVNNGLYAVIDLPAGIFEPYSKVKTSVLLIDKSLKTSNILFLKIQPSLKNTSYEINQGTPLNTKLVLEELTELIDKIRNSDVLPADLNKEVRILSKEKILNSKDSFLRSEYYFADTKHELWGMVALSQILEKSGEKVGNKKNIPVMSITMERGLIDQGEKFKKRIANIDISKYKLVKKNELVVGFPIDEGVLGFQTKYESAAVSPAYDIWKITRDDIPVEYLEGILRSPEAISLYKSAMKGTANRRRVVPKDIFLSLKFPLPNEKLVRSTTDKIISLKQENISLINKIQSNKNTITETLSNIWSK